jgi:hypothetical protein
MDNKPMWRIIDENGKAHYMDAFSAKDAKDELLTYHESSDPEPSTEHWTTELLTHEMVTPQMAIELASQRQDICLEWALKWCCPRIDDKSIPNFAIYRLITGDVAVVAEHEGDCGKDRVMICRPCKGQDHILFGKE